MKQKITTNQLDVMTENHAKGLTDNTMSKLFDGRYNESAIQVLHAISILIVSLVGMAKMGMTGKGSRWWEGQDLWLRKC